MNIPKPRGACYPKLSLGYWNVRHNNYCHGIVLNHGTRPNRFIFNCTSPLLVAFIVLMPFLVRPPEILGWVAVILCELTAVFVLLGLFDAHRFWYCWRAVGGIVFLAYVSYLISMIIAGEFIGNGRRSSVSALNAAVGLFVFGLPGALYAVFGRLTFRSEPEVADDYCDSDEIDDEDSDDPCVPQE